MVGSHCNQYRLKGNAFRHGHDDNQDLLGRKYMREPATTVGTSLLKVKPITVTPTQGHLFDFRPTAELSCTQVQIRWKGPID